MKRFGTGAEPSVVALGICGFVSDWGGVGLSAIKGDWCQINQIWSGTCQINRNWKDPKGTRGMNRLSTSRSFTCGPGTNCPGNFLSLSLVCKVATRERTRSRASSRWGTRQQMPPFAAPSETAKDKSALAGARAITLTPVTWVMQQKRKIM
jgi:hypothetical protein